jgi:tetratricopeptide (TPR) repeat protein
MTNSPPNRSDGWVSAGIALATFALYASGACPTIYVGDSGELVAASYTLGIPHPSGYPLYVLLGKLWTFLVPIGSIAYRMSLFSAAAASLAVALLYALLRKARSSRPAALLGALTLGACASFWAEANVQRVYALNALFLVATLLTLLHWRESRSSRSLGLAFLLAGLGAANHTFMAIATLALAAFVAIELRSDGARSASRATRALAVGARAGLAFALGLLPYLYLPLRSRADPALDWGDPESARALFEVLTRREFWERAWIETPRDLVPIVGDWFASIPSEITFAGGTLAVAGLLSRTLPLSLRVALVILLAVNVGAMALHGSRGDLFIWHRYYIPSYVVSAVFAGAGLDALTRRVPRHFAWLALAIPALLVANNRSEQDRSHYRIADDFARAVLESLPPGAHLAATDDNVLFALLYLHFVEGLRPDIHLVLQGVGKAHLPQITFDPSRNPLFFTHHPNWNLPELDVVPVGVVFRAWRRSDPRPEPAIPRRELLGETDPRVPKDYLTQNLIGHFHYMLGLTELERDWPRARDEFSRAVEIAAQNDVLFYNLGLIFRRSGLYAEALQAFERSAEINPRHLASQSKPLAADRIVEVRAERERIAQMERELQHEVLERTGLRPSTAAYQSALAELFEARGETTAAIGSRLRAQASTTPESSP